MGAFKFILFSFMIVLHVRANACRDPLSETRTFLERLPKSAFTMPIVAKIKILSPPDIEDGRDHVRAEVISAQKGIAKGKIIKVVSDSNSSCGRDPKLKPGDEYFIAGSMGTDGLFRGQWKQKDLENEKATGRAK